MSESENIDVPNNLCVAEDAFEQFQAESTYEEDEFITLSDIVEPPQPSLDLNACLDEAQDDICIVSVHDPKRDENILSECTVETNQELLIPVSTDTSTNCDRDSSLETGFTISSVQDASQNTSQSTPKKRGRRKKNTIPTVNVKQQLNTSSDSVTTDYINQSSQGKKNSDCIMDSDNTVLERLNQSTSSDLDTLVTQTSNRRKRKLNNDIPVKAHAKATDDNIKPRKRGRPKKVNTVNILLHHSPSNQDAIQVEKPSNQAPGVSHIETSMEDEKINKSSISDKDLSCEQQPSNVTVVKRKRGRPKKSNFGSKVTNQSEHNEVTNTSSITVSQQSSSVSSTKAVKRKSKKNINNKKYDEIELELLRMLSTPTEELEKKCINETENQQKPPKKRGRKPIKLDKKVECIEKTLHTEAKQVSVDEENHDEADDICLSSLKKCLKPEDDHEEESTSIVNEKVSTIDSIDDTTSNILEISTKRNSKRPLMADFEYNVDTIVSASANENVVEENVAEMNNPELESPSKRPIRRKAKKILHYDEGSDEDPFANVELSDDDGDLSGRRGGRYYSDDEYIPGKRKKGKAYSESESSVSGSELENKDGTVAKKLSKRRSRKSDELRKCYKKSKKNDVTQNTIPDVTSTVADTTTQNDDDLEHSLQSSDITTNENCNQKPTHMWDSSHEFENFLVQKIQGTNLKIKKLSGTTSNECAITPLEIPVLDPNEPKKTVEISTQTNKTSTNTVEVQTTSPYESIMKSKVSLTAEQSEKACEFLKGIVKNTSELGQLMIQKSEDFIHKKINTRNVTDTIKMDYCVQKSFLLFKLAKHNLIQMEEDLANEYEQFLKTHNMTQYRESPKCIMASSKHTNSDSDCEIVEEPIPDQEKEKEKTKFNLKTVFLNKELSIKIAKKSTEEPQTKKENINIKSNRHTVWINDSIMVKKVKPTQSFLAQDSRNKKPPDTYVSIEMVKKFFDNYYKRQQALLTCASLVSPEWLNVKQISVCNYFIAQANDMSTHSRILLTPQSESETNVGLNRVIKDDHIAQPTSLLALCTKAMHMYMYDSRLNSKETFVAVNNHYLTLEQKYQPKTLFRLSFNVISNMLVLDHNKIRKKEKKTQNINSLKKLCLRSVNAYIHKPIIVCNLTHGKGSSNIIEDFVKSQNSKTGHVKEINTDQQIQRNVKSLFSYCVEVIQKNNFPKQQNNNLDENENSVTFNKMKTLKSIAFANIKQYLYKDLLDRINEKNTNTFNETLEQQSLPFIQNYIGNACHTDTADQLLALTIKSVNSLSDDFFAKLPGAVNDEASCSEGDDSNYDEYEPGVAESSEYDNLAEESNWVSRVQLQELKSCFMPIEYNSNALVIKDSSYKECVLASIKIEPLEETSENVESSIIKTEIVENDVTIFNPLATKLENIDNEVEDIPERTSSSYDVDAFEEFARTSKMFHTTANCDFANDEVFSQSALRVRKQHEPDMDDEFDTSMSLLVPQQNTELAKDRLMKSSSDDESKAQKNVIKKKRKLRSKITRQKNKDMNTSKNKNTPGNEVAILTRKMQERIRQEEKLNGSSDSEFEDSLAKLKQDKLKKASVEKEKLKCNNDVDNLIQCSDVDSTENLNDKTINKNKKEMNQIKTPKILLRKKLNGFNIINNNDSTLQNNSFVIQPDAPVELLECEPTLPIMHDDIDNTEMENEHIEEKSHEPVLPDESSYIDRHGWKCYPVNDYDTKLYEHTYILLEKLPESFVETYFKYQDVADKNQEDNDINRLTNLQSLHRTSSKDNKVGSKTSRMFPNGQLKSRDTECDPQSSNLINDEYCNELSPSDDEGATVDDEFASAPPQDTTENVLAKNSLMNDMDSDSEKTTNPEVDVTTNTLIKKEKDEEPRSKTYKPGPKSRKVVKENDFTLLTADKMMNKELALLHAPVILDAEDVKFKDTNKKPSPKNLNKISTRLRAHLERTKLREESSSDEEKQWVSTKEKLLKRLGRKQENSSVDDAKRAKIVSEFIEKRGDAHDKRPIVRPRKRRSRKKFLERKKQMSVLNRELFGETDTTYAGRTHSQAFGKGRRNIRKVIDKKSLARSTVIANMEEFERKRRLNMQQTKLREELGCEEGVNVLVINDEVCLEYDFEQMCPVVTIHPFFTRVMKAHQYEGVKFMWDACFESLAMVASGHAGGGCILAHCMGLGKTLQVLALLHTVLTHPGVGMKRVLVCCPLSTVLNWVDEINKWIGPVTNQIKVFELSKLKKTYERAYQLEDWYKDGGIFIIGYELFRSLTTLDPVLDDVKPKIVDKIRHALLNPGPDVVICDEGHLLKNDSSVLAVAMSRVATRRRIVLTGTPMQNNLREYYCMVNFVKPSLLGTYAEYSNRFENPIMNGQHRDSHEEDIKLMKARTHILHKVLEGCLQRQEASVLYPYLPKKHEYTVFIPPTKCQWDLYKHYMMTYALEQQQQNKQQKQSLLKDFHVLQKIWTHPQVLHNFLMKARDERNKIKEEKLEDDLAQEDLAASEDVKPNETEVWWLQYLAGGDMLESLESSNKFVVIFQLLDEFITLGDKVLIFSTSLYTLDALEYFLKRINKWSLGQEYFRLDGSVPAEVRQKWCREFNAPNNVNTKLFLISTRAGCLGLNMTAANRVIILDTSWNPAHDIQSIFRVYRFGQKKDCYIYRLVAMGTMEQKIYERSVTKQAVSCRVVDEQQIDRHYNMAELTELYRYDEEGATVEAGLAAGVSDVALLRVAARARLHAVREHDSLLRGSREQHLPEHERNAAWMQFQQEHANNEMQDRLMEASQGIQRILEANYAKSSGSIPVKMENEEPPPQTLSQPGPKGRKSKKKAAVNFSPPLEDVREQKDTQLDPEKEEAKVKKIMQLLIKHNFHTSERAHEITNLVTNVRSIVDARGAGLGSCDELTRSIATVMLQEEDVPILPIKPPLTDIITGDIISSPGQTEGKLEIPHDEPDKIPHYTPDDITDERHNEVPDETPEEITDRTPYKNNTLTHPSEGSLLGPAMETRRQRERNRRYFANETFELPIKRPRRQLRKNTTDSERSLVDDEIDTPLQLRTNRSTYALTGKKSKRLVGRPRKYQASDLNNADPVYPSKEQSPEIVAAPVLAQTSKRKINKSITHITPESNVTLIDDEDTRSKDSETVVVPDVTEKTMEPETKKPKRAIAVKSTAKINRSETKLNGKIRRRAALAAEKHLEKLDDEDVVTLDDDDDEWVDDSDKNFGRNRSTGKMTTPPRALGTKKYEKTKTTSNIETRSSSQTDATSKKQKESSILLSDDDDREQTNVETSSDVPTNSIDSETDEAIPLHPSMLSNENFIKIVAYAYQSNRMLDEDAALLAARYSTQKALNEYETTGKDVISGPLYDIAVKFLTKDVLKKLINKRGSKRRVASHSAANSVDLTSSKLETSNVHTAQDVTITENRNPPQNYESVSSDYTTQPNVVPVGMFRGSAMNQKSHEVVEECILPDDDDCILGTTDDTLPSQNIYKKTNTQQLILTSVKTTNGGRRESQPVSTVETILPEIESSVMVSTSQPVKPAPRVEPIITITERPKYILGPNTPTYRLSKSNLKIEPTTPELERTNMLCSRLHPQLTLTISEGKLIQPNVGALDLNAGTVSKRISLSNVTQSSNDTICLDSDEEDVGAPNKVAKIVHLPPPFKSGGSTAPTPVAVTTSVSGFPILNNTHGAPAITRANNGQSQANSVITPEAQTKVNQNSKNQQKITYLLPTLSSSDDSNQQTDARSSKTSNKATSDPISKLPKCLPKPSESTKRDVPHTSSKTVISPEYVLSRSRIDKQAKKMCKPGDILRIGKDGNLAVKSKVENKNSQMLNSSKDTESQQSVADKRKPFSSSVRSQSPGNDPLSILKDVIHIQAKEYDKSTSKTNSDKANKTYSHIESNKLVPSKSQSKEISGKIKLQYPTKNQQDTSKAPLKRKIVIEPVVQVKKKEAQLKKKELTDIKLSSKPAGGTIDLTNMQVNNKTIAVVHKPTEKTTPKGSVIVGSSKDIIIRTKQTGSTLTKVSTSATNTNLKTATATRESAFSDNKKRVSSWPDTNSPKRKMDGILRPAQTLEDFDIDDIDDIIELE